MKRFHFTNLALQLQMVLDYDQSRNIRRVVDRFEWIFMPVVNVDGYIYTRQRVQHIIDLFIAVINSFISVQTKSGRIYLLSTEGRS